MDSVFGGYILPLSIVQTSDGIEIHLTCEEISLNVYNDQILKRQSTRQSSIIDQNLNTFTLK